MIKVWFDILSMRLIEIFFFSKEKVLEAADIVKDKAAEGAKIGSEYAEVLGEKAINAAGIAKEYAT